MSVGLVGKKCGMTRIFKDDGTSVPVTVLEVLPNRVVQLKTIESDGYGAIQVTMGEKKISRVSKPLRGHYKKAKEVPGYGLWEFRLSEAEKTTGGEELNIGSQLTVDIFREGQFVDVRGVSKGKGYAGVIKKHHFSRQNETHGNSISHRAPGSIGQRQTPGKVFKGKKMAGHLGNANRTIQNQKVVRVDSDRNLLLIKGAVPGAPGGYVVVTSAMKKSKNKGDNNSGSVN